MQTFSRSKRAFYSLPAVAASYDSLRFGGSSGAWVNARELALIRSLLPPSGRVLDLACGTGRLATDLAPRGYSAVAVDTSAEMLRLARGHTSAPAILGDAFGLPFADGTFDAVVALRLLFHYPDPRPLLGQMARAVRPGGSVIFDTYHWTPRSLVALAPGRWGGKVFTHSASLLLRQAHELGLAAEAAEACFLCSPYLYRLLPLPAVRVATRLERVVPPRWRARTFWKFVRTEVRSGRQSAGSHGVAAA